MNAVSNPCDEMNCTSLCLLTAASPTRSNCSCPTGFVIDVNQTECIGKLFYTFKINIGNSLSTFSTVSPHLLFTLASPYIRRVDLDGRRQMNLYTGGVPRGIDFDYR